MAGSTTGGKCRTFKLNFMNMAKKIIILIASLAFLPFGVLAKDNWELQGNKNVLSLAGECSVQEIRVDPFLENSEKPIYTSVATCQEGKFDFRDDLLQWKSLPDGEYSLVVNGDQKNTRKVSIKRPEESVAVAAAAANADLSAAETPDDPDTKFLNAFVAFQQALLDMRTWLSETKYPTLVKTSLDALIDGVDGAAGKIAELMWSAENPEEIPAEPELPFEGDSRSLCAVLRSAACLAVW